MSTSNAGGGPVTVTAPDGSSLAQETTAGQIAGAAETVAEAVAPGGVPTPGQPALAVVNVDPAPTFAAAPPTATEAPAIRVVGDGLDRDNNPILRVLPQDGAGVVATQGDGNEDPDSPAWKVASLIDGVLKPLATQETAETTATTTQAIEDAVDGLEGGQTAANASLASIDGKIPASPAQEHVIATSPHAVRQTDGTTFYKGAVAGDNMGADVRVLNAPVTELNPIPVRPDPLFDTVPGRTSTGAYAVAEREVLMNNVNTTAFNTRIWGTSTANGGTVTYDPVTGTVTLAVTGVSGSSAVMQTHAHFPYEPGATSHPVLTLAQADAGQANQVRRWGQFSPSDGLFYELNGTTLRMMRRSSVSGSPVDTLIAEQANWVDPYPGLNLTFIQRWALDFQWLSSGKTKAIVNDAVRHWLDFGNTLTLPVFRTAHLPIRIEITNTGASVASSMRYICSTMYLLGGTALKSKPEIYAMSAPRAGITTTPTPILALRVRSDIGGFANRSIILPRSATITNESGSGTVRMWFNPTSITGGVWAPTAADHGLEFNEGLTARTGGIPAGHVILPLNAGKDELDGGAFFALNGTHMLRLFDGTVDSIVFEANARVGTFTADIVARWIRIGAD